MRKEFTFQSKDGTTIYAYKWEAQHPKAAVQITHGAVEHALRYDEFALMLVKEGYTVYAVDLRGHGKTAGKPENVPYFSDSNGGCDLIVEDMSKLTDIIKSETGLPVFLFAHSMGSFMARIYAARYGEKLKGLMLTGTGRKGILLLSAGKLLARLQMIVLGRRHKSPLLHSLIFGILDAPFKGEGRSSFICSDKSVVEAYRADEYCGNTVTAEFAFELMYAMRAGFKKRTFMGCPKNLHVFIGAGEFDSVGGKNLSGVKQDVEDYKSAGVVDLEFHIYEGMRHEILNEKQRKRVYDDITAWLNKRA